MGLYQRLTCMEKLLPNSRQENVRICEINQTELQGETENSVLVTAGSFYGNRLESLSPFLLSLSGYIFMCHKGLWSNSMWKFKSWRKDSLSPSWKYFHTEGHEWVCVSSALQQLTQMSASLLVIVRCDYWATIPRTENMMSQSIRLEEKSLSLWIRDKLTGKVWERNEDKGK